jgi:hypothetical protein
MAAGERLSDKKVTLPSSVVSVFFAGVDAQKRIAVLFGVSD